MTELEQLREDLKAERLRVASLRTLVASLEKQRDFFQKELDKLVRSKLEFKADTLDSERRANEILTNEVERLENANAELRARLLEARR